MKKCKHRRADDLYNCTNIGSDEDDKHGDLHKSSCCDAKLIHYSVYEKCFLDEDGKVLITAKGIDKIDVLIKIIKSKDFERKISIWNQVD